MHIFSATFTLILTTLVNLTGDWFFAVALITIGVKLLLFPMSVKQQRTQLIAANLNQAKPILSNKFHNKTEQVNSALMKIASKYSINPLFSLLPLIIQAPIFFSLYFSVLNLSSTVGSILFPWISSIHSIDNLHILPVIAGTFQGLGALSISNKNLLVIFLTALIGIAFLWEAPAALSAYWIINSILRFIEIKIFSLKLVRRKFLNIPSSEEMVESTM